MMISLMMKHHHQLCREGGRRVTLLSLLSRAERGFHSSLPAALSRHTGSKALEPSYRPPSKKQMKRHVRKLGRQSLVKDHRQERIKATQLNRFMDSPQLKEYMDDMGSKLDQPIKASLLPKSPEEAPASLAYADVDADRVLRKLKSLQLTAAATTAAASSIEKEDHPPQDTFTSAVNNSLEEVTLELAPPSAAAPAVPAPVEQEEKRKRNEKLANRAVIKYALAGDVASMMELLALMKPLGLTVNTRAGVRSIIKCATKAEEYSIANEFIDAALRDVDNDDNSSSSSASSDLKDVVSFDIFLWEAKVRVLGESGDAAGALAVMEHLLKLGLLPTPAMYTSVLKSYVRLNRLEEAYKFWERMHDDNVDINAVAFAAMMQYCAKTDKAERAFFYFDEMKEAYKVEPTLEVFLNLFAACATAPHFVGGYESFIFDAMILMEAAEMAPTKSIYDQVIRAFASARDPVAAEYYYFEMKRKGFQPNEDTYVALLDAYARAQSVGASTYSSFGRYSKPKPAPLTADEQAMLTVGPLKTFKMLASNYDFEYEYEHGKRNKPVVTNRMEEDPEGGELFMEQVRREARKIRVQGIRTQMRLEEEEEDRLYLDSRQRQSQISSSSSSSSSSSITDRGTDRGRGRGRDSSDDLVALGQTDPGLKRILDDMRRDDPELEVSVDDEALLEELNAMPGSDDEEEEEDDDNDDDEEEKDDDLQSRDGGRSRMRVSPIYADDHPDLQRMYDIISDTSASDFTDPFDHLPGAKGKLMRRRRAIVSHGKEEEEGDGDGKEEEEEVMIQEGGPTRGDSLLQSTKDRRHNYKGEGEGAKKKKKKGGSELKEALIDLLDGKPTPTALAMMSNTNNTDDDDVEEEEEDDDDDTTITDDKIALAWDEVEFGRAPPANYSATLNVRRKINKARATLAFHQMLKDGYEPSSASLDAYLSVFTEARTEADVLPVLDLYDKFGVERSSRSYCSLVTMYVKAKDIKKAMELLHGEMMTQRGLVPDSSTFGLMIESATHRGMVVEALRLLEQATEMKVTVPEKHLRILRSRCASLGVSHPDMRADPQQWVKDLKVTRRKLRNSSQRTIESLRSATYY